MSETRIAEMFSFLKELRHGLFILIHFSSSSFSIRVNFRHP